MKPEVGELVSAAEIARRLNLSGERIRQLARDGRLPEPVGRSGRSTLWRWDEVAAWAEATARRAEDLTRPPPQAWKPVGEPDGDFTLVADEVIPYERRGLVHARVWVPAGSELRPVVLLGNLDDNRAPSVTNRIDLVAMTVAAKLLGADGLRADWYEYWPDTFGQDHTFHAVTFASEPMGRVRGSHGRRRGGAELARSLGGYLTDPKWLEVPREALERLVGETVHLFPHGAYTSTVLRDRDGDAPRVAWDPEDLRPDIDAAVVLVTDPVLEEIRPTTAAVARLLATDHGRRSRINEQDAARQPRGLGIVLEPYRPAPAIVHALDQLQETPALAGPTASSAALLGAREVLRRWLLTHGTPEDRAALVAGTLGLTWLAPYFVCADDAPHGGAPAVAAVRQADRRLSDVIDERYPTVAASEHPLLVPSDVMDASTPTAREYLSRLTPVHASDVDPSRISRLRGHLSDGRESWGTDPWGRLVLNQGRYFLAEWPVGPNGEAVLDSVLVRAEASDDGAAVFLEWPDGRLDLLPASADGQYETGFTWGYSGGGPRCLAESLQLLVNDSVGTRIYELVVGTRRAEFRVTVGHLRALAEADLDEVAG